MLKEKLHDYVIDSYREQGSMPQAYLESNSSFFWLGSNQLMFIIGFEKIEKEAIAKLESCSQKGGSTALCLTIIDDYIYTANLGDSRAMIISESGFTVLNKLHDFTNKEEEIAVAQRGGVIIERGVTKRLFGEFAISRSIGDYNYKQYISSVPELSEYRMTSSDRFLLLATDGFWNVIINL